MNMRWRASNRTITFLKIKKTLLHWITTSVNIFWSLFFVYLSLLYRRWTEMAALESFLVVLSCSGEWMDGGTVTMGLGEYSVDLTLWGPPTCDYSDSYCQEHDEQVDSAHLSAELWALLSLIIAIAHGPRPNDPTSNLRRPRRKGRRLILAKLTRIPLLQTFL